MTDADKRINALIDRAGCPMMVVKNTEQKSFEDVRRSILHIADEQYDGSLIDYIRDLADKIDRLEGALENVIIERDAALEKVPKWISVDERLPEKCGTYLTATKNGAVRMNHFYHRHSVFGYKNDATHWMPLPEPPEEQKGGEEE